MLGRMRLFQNGRGGLVRCGAVAGWVVRGEVVGRLGCAVVGRLGWPLARKVGYLSGGQHRLSWRLSFDAEWGLRLRCGK